MEPSQHIHPIPNQCKPSHDSLDNLMAQIADLQADLNIVESTAPQLIETIRATLRPYAQHMAARYAEFILWLSAEYHKPRISGGYRCKVSELAEMLCDKARDAWGINLGETMIAAGFAQHDLGTRSTESPQHPKANRSKRAKKAATTSISPEQLKKSLYHGLARDLHPDKATHADSARRTALMQQLNQANSSGDMRSLLELLHIHGSQELKTGLNTDSLPLLKQTLEQQKISLKMQIRAHLDRLPDIGIQWLIILRDPTAQARIVHKQKQNALKEEALLQKHCHHLRKPQALATFFKKYGADDWSSFF